MFDRFDSSPKLLHTLFVWAEKRPGFQSSAALFNSVINVLAKSKQFESAWSLVLDRIGGDEEQHALVSGDTFAVMIRRYARAGNNKIEFCKHFDYGIWLCLMLRIGKFLLSHVIGAKL